MRRSIARRLLISSLVILVAFLGIAAAALDRAFRSSAESAARDRLQAHVYTLLTSAKEDDQGRMRLPEILAAPDFNQPDSGLYAKITGENGNYRWRSRSLLGRKAPTMTPQAPGQTRFRFSGEFAVIDQGILWEDDRGNPIDYSITVAADITPFRDELEGFRNTLWLWLGGVGVLLLLSQLLLVRWGLRPLREMTDAVRRVEQGESAQIEGRVPRELTGLADNLNSLITQNQTRQERVRNSLADLAHSMKTPLAVLRGAADSESDSGVRQLIREQTQRINEIVTYQRQRAAVAGSSSVTRPIELAPIVKRLCASLDKVYRDKHPKCSMSIDDGLRLRADEGDMFELFGNLLENAYKHCRSRVEVRAERDSAQVRINIQDDGDGIADQDIQRLLQRGERADQRHPGEGIGLSVVNEVVKQYGGELNIVRADLGGACIRIAIPA